MQIDLFAACPEINLVPDPKSMAATRLINGDCLIEMQAIEDNSVDLIFADLPYGTTQCKWDVLIPFNQLWAQWKRVSKPNTAIVLTAQQPFATDLINSNRKLFRYEIIWEKTQKLGFLNANKMPLRGHENILVFYQKLPTYNPQKYHIETTDVGRSSPHSANRYAGYSGVGQQGFIRSAERHPHSVVKISNWNGTIFGRDSRAVKHPTQKPVELMEWIVKTYSNEGDTVLDCCMGSGTTGVACQRTGRNFIGIEKEHEFFAVAQGRIVSH